MKFTDCGEAGLRGFDACLAISFSYLEEFAGLNMVGGSANVMSGKLYDTDGEVNADSRVSYTHAGNEDKFFVSEFECETIHPIKSACFYHF